MDFPWWIKKSQSVAKGISILNQLEEAKFEQFLFRIVTKFKLQDTEIFTEEERVKLIKIFKVDEDSLLMAIKTVLYIFKRILKFIFMPVDLKTDLRSLGLKEEKAELFVKVWSTETREALEELATKVNHDTDDSINFPWHLNAELSSDYHKKCNVPKAYISFTTNRDVLDLELTHSDAYSIFLQFESIQNELDNFM